LLCACAEKNVALQQQLTELTASHEAAMEAMETAHSKEIDSLKETISVQGASRASDTETATVTIDLANSVSNRAIDVVPSACGLCDNGLSDIQSLKDIAALYHAECVRTALLQSKLNTVSEFIAYIDKLDQSTGIVGERLSGDRCKDESLSTSERSYADILAAVRTFASSYRQAVSDSPLQVENLHRLERCSLRHVKFSACELSEGSSSLMTSAESRQPSSSSSAKSSVSVTVVCSDWRQNCSEDAVAAVNVEQSEGQHQSPVNSNDTNAGRKHLESEMEEKKEVEDEILIAAEVTQEICTSNDERPNRNLSDSLHSQLQEQLDSVNRKFKLQTAELTDTVSELSRYKERSESQASEISSLREEMEYLQAKNAKITSQISEKEAFEDQCSVMQSELDEMKYRTSQLQEEVSGLKKDKDSLQMKAEKQAEELDTKNRAIETLDDRVLMIRSELDVKSKQLEEKMSELEAAKQIHAAADESSQLRTELAQSESQRDDLMDELQSLKENLAALEVERDMAKGQVNQKSEEFESILVEKVTEHQRKCDILAEELQTSQNHVTKLCDELHQSRDIATELETKVETSAADCADLKQQLFLLKSELESCRQDSEQSFQLLQKERDFCQSELRVKEAKLATSADEICSLRENIERLNAEISEKDDLSKAHEAKLQQIAEQYNSQLAELQSSAEERSSHEQTLLEEDFDLRTAKLSTAEQCLHEKTSELAQAKEVYETKIEQLSSTVDELRNRLESEKKLCDAEVVKLTGSHNAELVKKDYEIAALEAAVNSLKEARSSTHDEQSSALQCRDEIASAAEQQHKAEVAAVMEKCEKRISQLECDHCRTVELYRERIAEMERSDIELNTQLIAVTEKFNSVTEYTATAERMIEDYRSQADTWAAEREDMRAMAETTSVLLSEREAEIVALKEQILLLKQHSSSVHDMPSVKTKGDEAQVADMVNRVNSGSCNTGNSSHLSHHGVSSKTFCPDSTRHETELVRLQQENLNLTGHLCQQQSEDVASLKEQHDQIIAQITLEHRAAVEDLEERHNSKVVQLIKQFNAQMAAQEKELQETMNSDLG